MSVRVALLLLFSATLELRRQYLIISFQEDEIFECPQSYTAVWTMWADYEELRHGDDDPGPGLTEAHLVQAAPHRVGHQEGEGRGRHPALHPAGEVVHQREEDGGVRRVSSDG